MKNQKRKLNQPETVNIFLNTFDGPISIVLRYVHYRFRIHCIRFVSKDFNDFVVQSLYNNDLKLSLYEIYRLRKLTKLTTYFIKQNVFDPSAKNNYAIRTTSENGHSGVIKLLSKSKNV